jgi:aspartyl protease family protein
MCPICRCLSTISVIDVFMRPLALACMLLLGLTAGAQPTQAPPSISLAGQLGGKSLLVIGGSAPKAMSEGETHLGVKLVSSSKDQVLVEQAGRQYVVRMGEGLVGSYVQPTSASRRIVLRAASGGHYHTAGLINGQYVDFLVDTGASVVTMGISTAEALGLPYKGGQRVRGQTANGVVTGFLLMLDSVKVGDVVLYQVEAFVTPAPMSRVLLGNSFLGRFDMSQSQGTLVLEMR